jgi:hypothetical protein
MPLVGVLGCCAYGGSTSMPINIDFIISRTIPIDTVDTAIEFVPPY